MTTKKGLQFLTIVLKEHRKITRDRPLDIPVHNANRHKNSNLKDKNLNIADC